MNTKQDQVTESQVMGYGCGCFVVLALIVSLFSLCSPTEFSGEELRAEQKRRLPWLVTTDLHKGTAADWMSAGINEKMTVAADSIITKGRIDGLEEPDVFSPEFKAEIIGLVGGINTACKAAVDEGQENMKISEILSVMFVYMDKM